MTRKTSIETYRAIQADGTLSRLRLFVYNMLYKHGPMSANEIIRLHGKTSSHGALSTRLSELRNLGIIEEIGFKKDPLTGRTNIVWQTNDKLPIALEKPIKHKCNFCDGKGYLVEQQTKFNLKERK